MCESISVVNGSRKYACAVKTKNKKATLEPGIIGFSLVLKNTKIVPIQDYTCSKIDLFYTFATRGLGQFT